MIYTVGVKDSYLQAYALEKENGTVLKKAGRNLDLREEEYPDGYVGGSVWKTRAEARRYCQREHIVFGVLADWDTQTAPTLEKDPDTDWHDLLVDSEIVILPFIPTTVGHCKRTPYDVYIGRGSPWGNPFSHLDGTKAIIKVASREEAIQAYDDWLEGTSWKEVLPKKRQWILDHIHELRELTLGCFCFPKACHGNVLARRANDL